MDNSRHFFAAAAEAMRRILIERARQKASLKRGGDREDRVELADIEPAVLPLACDDILGLDEALQKLRASASAESGAGQAAFLCRTTTAQAAEMQGISTSTAENDWTYARSWLRLEMSGDK